MRASVGVVGGGSDREKIPDARRGVEGVMLHLCRLQALGFGLQGSRGASPDGAVEAEPEA
jgi:hypothetical protein